MQAGETAEELFEEMWDRETAASIDIQIRSRRRCLRVQQDWNASVGPHGIHSEVWPAGLVLQSWLQDQPMTDVRVVEIGAGTGVVGLVLAVLGARVVLTDAAPALPLLAHNAAAVADFNPRHRPDVRHLDWSWAEACGVGGEELVALEELAAEADVVVAADCIYNPSSFPRLAATLAALLRRREQRCLMANARRGVEDAFLALLRERGLGVRVCSCVRAGTEVHGPLLRAGEEVVIYEVRPGGASEPPGAELSRG